MGGGGRLGMSGVGGGAWGRRLGAAARGLAAGGWGLGAGVGDWEVSIPSVAPIVGGGEAACVDAPTTM
jgi:hypothetical protein